MFYSYIFHSCLSNSCIMNPFNSVDSSVTAVVACFIKLFSWIFLFTCDDYCKVSYIFNVLCTIPESLNCLVFNVLHKLHIFSYCIWQYFRFFCFIFFFVQKSWNCFVSFPCDDTNRCYERSLHFTHEMAGIVGMYTWGVNGVGSDYYRTITKRFDRRTIGVDSRACVAGPNTPVTAYTHTYFDTVTTFELPISYHNGIEIHLNYYAEYFESIERLIEINFLWYVTPF